MPSVSAVHRIIPNPDRGLGLSLLGADYERKKQKLKQELQLDYKQYVAKKKEQKHNEARPQRQGLSLLFDENLSVKERQDRLREERNKEYNLFLQNKAKNRRFKKQTPPVTLKPGQVQTFPASPLTILNKPTHSPPPHSERPHRRDAATLTKTVDKGTSKRSLASGRQGRRQWQRNRDREAPSSEEEQITDREEELAFRQRRRKDRRTPEPEYKDEGVTREHGANRVPKVDKEVSTHDHNNVWIWKSDLKIPENITATTRSRPTTSINKAEMATALIFGRKEDPAASQMRKEQYRQELLKQIAEERRNKMREKKLELRVAATGATDPEKDPERIKQFANRHHDNWRQDTSYKPGLDVKSRGRDPDPRPKDTKPTENTEKGNPHGNSQVDYSRAVSQLTGRTVPKCEIEAERGVPSLDHFNEDYHRDFSNLLDVAIPRDPGVLPPLPPAITNNYQTPYDAPYYYYGTRNPLDSHLHSYQNGQPRAAEQSGNFHTSPPRPPPVRPSDLNEVNDQHKASLVNVGTVPAHNTRQRRESYTEALKQQIKEREERKRREKEEKEQYNAKIEAEMMLYNPWGRSGGGAPIKDVKGNVFSDLNQMHKINEELYRNPLVRNTESRTQQAAPTGFNDQPTPQQLHMKENYTEALKQQIEENKRKKAEERAKIRAEEEKEERRLAEQRARMLREYEEEQKKQKKIKHGADKKSWIEPKTQPQKEVKRPRQAETEIKIPENTKDREEKTTQPSYEKPPSPPIPTLRKKQVNMLDSESFGSQVAPTTELSVTENKQEVAPSGSDGQQDVLRQLSSLRRDLQKEKEKSQMEIQRAQTDRQENHYTPTNRYYSETPLHRRGPVSPNASSDVLRRREHSSPVEMVQNQSGHPPAHHSDAALVNMQNIREFNQLKHRDTASREEVLHMYPDPPTDAESLDIQQQALLRKQQHKLKLMKRENHDFLEQQPNHYPTNNPGRFIERDSILASESAFIDVYSGAAREELVHQRSSRRPSAEHQGRNHDYDHVNTRQHDIQPDTQEVKVRGHSRYRIRRQDSDTGQHNNRSEKLPGDEVDASSQHFALERQVSMETVATDPWLRPGTSNFVKRLSSRRRPTVVTGNLPFL